MSFYPPFFILSLLNVNGSSVFEHRVIPTKTYKCMVSDIQDVAQLWTMQRLLLSQWTNKTSLVTFRYNFYRKKIQLTEENLQAFVAVTQKEWLGCHLQHLTVVDVPAGDDQTIAEERAVVLLQWALTNLRVNSGHGLLESLTLTFEREENAGAPWKSTWEAAAKLFRVSTVALDTKSTSPAAAVSNSSITPDSPAVKCVGDTLNYALEGIFEFALIAKRMKALRGMGTGTTTIT
ncbi:hypothetical protein BDV27DRAFT_151889 [Aspergillus caelatus]|uniref:Uncharacterized protein n=1 Tax=Aspergillus caelatus TaxID=61420 RepID=A0A5N7ALA7_9EURO|nr:uncharacterized protein BDV27DRAFT_151889 [Aspergillus caelatus]KAE8370631.1 hypothetical protein BDV27DRAFT_151889 [Aspergillus caelatus]